MSTRQELTDWLTDHVPAGFTVEASARSVTPGGKGTVQVLRQSVAPAPNLGQGRVLHRWAIWLVVPYKDSEAGEDALDDALDEVWSALDGQPWLALEVAERGTYEGDYIAYKITATTAGSEVA